MKNWAMFRIMQGFTNDPNDANELWKIFVDWNGYVDPVTKQVGKLAAFINTAGEKFCKEYLSTNKLCWEEDCESDVQTPHDPPFTMCPEAPPLCPSVTFPQPPELQSEDGVLTFPIDVVYANNRIDINSPQFGPSINFYGRTFNGNIGGATLRVKVGDKLVIPISNKLPNNVYTNNTDQNTPHKFNSINLHGHGFSVSPYQDDVFVEIKPTESYTYEYDIGLNHPAGHMWIHPHKHGATAMHLLSGMFSSVIFEGEEENGDLNTVEDIKDAEEIIFNIAELSLGKSKFCPYLGMFDLLSPHFRSETRKEMSTSWPLIITTLSFSSISPTLDGWGWGGNQPFGPPVPMAQEGDMFEVSEYVLNRGSFWIFDSVWLVNGKQNPLMEIVPGKAIRLRVLNGSGRNDCIFIIRNVNNPSEHVPFHILARDGITMPHVVVADKITLEPANRIDILIKFPEVGEYEIIREFFLPVDIPLARVSVQGATCDMDLYNGPLPVPTIARPIVESDVKEDRALVYDTTSVGGGPPLLPEFQNEFGNATFNRFTIDGKLYDKNRVDQLIPLGDVIDWNITNPASAQGNIAAGKANFVSMDISTSSLVYFNHIVILSLIWLCCHCLLFSTN